MRRKKEVIQELKTVIEELEQKKIRIKEFISSCETHIAEASEGRIELKVGSKFYILFIGEYKE